MYPYVAPHTAKIHTLITLGIRIRTNRLVLGLGSAFPVGSIPIARSTIQPMLADHSQHRSAPVDPTKMWAVGRIDGESTNVPSAACMNVASRTSE